MLDKQLYLDLHYEDGLEYTKDPTKFTYVFNRSDIKEIVVDDNGTVTAIKFKRKYGKFTRKVIKFKTK